MTVNQVAVHLLGCSAYHVPDQNVLTNPCLLNLSLAKMLEQLQCESFMLWTYKQR